MHTDVFKKLKFDQIWKQTFLALICKEKYWGKIEDIHEKPEIWFLPKKVIFGTNWNVWSMILTFSLITTFCLIKTEKNSSHTTALKKVLHIIFT